jgi:hypothetical protein
MPDFKPHAVIVTERSTPIQGQLWVCAILGVHNLLKIDLDISQGQASYCKQALRNLPKNIPAFGAVTGVVINYREDYAVKLDRHGKVIGHMDKAVKLGFAYIATLH